VSELIKPKVYLKLRIVNYMNISTILKLIFGGRILAHFFLGMKQEKLLQNQQQSFQYLTNTLYSNGIP